MKPLLVTPRSCTFETVTARGAASANPSAAARAPSPSSSPPSSAWAASASPTVNASHLPAPSAPPSATSSPPSCSKRYRTWPRHPTSTVDAPDQAIASAHAVRPNHFLGPFRRHRDPRPHAQTTFLMRSHTPSIHPDLESSATRYRTAPRRRTKGSQPHILTANPPCCQGPATSASWTPLGRRLARSRARPNRATPYRWEAPQLITGTRPLCPIPPSLCRKR